MRHCPSIGLGLGLSLRSQGGGFTGLLDTYSGAAAAYSLRALSSGWLAGDVVEVRPSRGLSAATGFTQGQITNGEMLDFVNGGTTDLYNSARYFNGTSAYVSINSNTLDPVEQDWEFECSYISGPATTSNKYVLATSSGTFLGVNATKIRLVPEVGIDVVGTSNVNDGAIHVLKYKRVGSVYSVYVDGVLENSASRATSKTYTSTNMRIMRGVGAVDSVYLAGTVFDLTLNGTTAYTGLGTSVTAWEDTIGSNDGTESNGAAYTGQPFDGFVSTWYDQSGNANNATQATTTAQPKIVSAGALVVGGLDFDGVDDFMTTASYAVELSQNSASVFAVYETTGSLTNARVLTEGDTAVGGSSQFIIPFEGGSSLFWVNGDETGTKPTGLALIGFDYDQTASTIKAFSNGSQSGADLSNPTLNSEQRNYTFIGSNTLGNILFGGTIKEVITYKSDQSANRAAIETNINEFYTIY